MADKERLHSLGRSVAAVEQRNAQLKGWQSGDTNKQPEYILASRKNPRVKFEDNVVFLAAAQSGDLEEVERLVSEEGADVNSVSKDGLTALHQVCDTERKSETEKRREREMVVWGGGGGGDETVLPISQNTET